VEPSTEQRLEVPTSSDFFFEGDHFAVVENKRRTGSRAAPGCLRYKCIYANEAEQCRAEFVVTNYLVPHPQNRYSTLWIEKVHNHLPHEVILCELVIHVWWP